MPLSFWSHRTWTQNTYIYNKFSESLCVHVCVLGRKVEWGCLFKSGRLERQFKGSWSCGLLLGDLWRLMFTWCWIIQPVVSLEALWLGIQQHTENFWLATFKPWACRQNRLMRMCVFLWVELLTRVIYRYTPWRHGIRGSTGMLAVWSGH